MATISSITIRPQESTQPVPVVGYLRVPTVEATLRVGCGIEHDAKASPLRNLNIMDTLTLAELGAEGFPASPGALGENIVLDGLDLRTLPLGTQLRLGEQAVIEIARLRTGCAKLHSIDARMPNASTGRIGVMGQVVTAGTIRVGDDVSIVTELESPDAP